MTRDEFIQRAALTLLNDLLNDPDFVIPDTLALDLMSRPHPDLGADPAAFLDWNMEALGRLAYRCAEALHRGLKAEADRIREV